MGDDQSPTVGQFLRQEREKRNISLETISRTTRITMRNLESLEKDDFQAFSAPIFLKSFLRAYAQAIGIDPHQVIAMYESKPDILEESAQSRKESPPAQRWNPFKFLIPLIIIIAAAIIIIFAVFRKPDPPPPPAASPAETSASPKAQALPPVKAPSPPEENRTPVSPPVKAEGLAEKAPPSPPETTAEKKALKHTVRVTAVEETWLRIQIDGRPAVDALLKPKETATWDAARRFEILVGNAGGVEVSFDGVPQGRLGKSGEVVRLMLPKE